MASDAVVEAVARGICKGRNFAGCDRFCRGACEGRYDTLHTNGCLDLARAAIAACERATEKERGT